MANEQYIIIPGTQQRVYDGTVVMLHRLPNLRWILHNGYYNYSGRKQKGWYFSSIPADTVMPAFPEDLVAMTVIDGTHPPMPPGPFPPGPFPPGPGPCPPVPPAPVPIPFTPQDKAQVDAAMLTVGTIEDRDRMSSRFLQDGKVVRVNDADGEGNVEYYSWNSKTSSWEEASLGYRYMTRKEITEAIADDIVDIVWSNENGALVITNNAGSAVAPVQLMGVSHDPIYLEEETTLRIPIYGKPDLVMKLPADRYIRSIRFEPTWTFPDGHVAPALVITVSDGATEEELAADASAMVNIYVGGDTATAKVIIEKSTGVVTANVKLSSIANNPLKVDNEGFWVDLSGVVGKNFLESGLLLVADGQGQFTYGGTGVSLDTTTAISDLTDPEKKVVTANLIADAISAAISALQITLEQRIADVEGRLSDLESKTDIGHGKEGEVLLATSSGDMKRSEYVIGQDTLADTDNDAIATENAMRKALSWRSFSS